MLVCNHVTPFDHVAWSLLRPCVTPSIYALPAALASLLHYRELGVTAGREALRTNVQVMRRVRRHGDFCGWGSRGYLVDGWDHWDSYYQLLSLSLFLSLLFL